MRIKEFSTVVTGKTPSTKNANNFNGNIPFFTPEDIANGYLLSDSRRHISELGFNSIKNNTINGISILVGCIGSDMGNVAITDITCATNQQINSITKISENVNPYYIYYYLSGQKEYLQKISGSTATPLLPKTDFEQLDIPIINKETQDAIVNCLSKIDNKISLNNSICSDLEAMAKQLYDYWFVQFDFPDENGKPYKSSGGKMVWNEELKREIPEGWKLCKIGDISNAHRGISYNGEQLSSNGIPMLTLGCANKDGSFNEDGIQLYSGECPINKYLSPFDLIIYNTDMSAKCYVIGRTILVPDIFDKVVSSHHLTNIRFDDDNYKWYFYQLTQTEFFRKYIVGFSTGTNVKGLDYRGVEEFVHEFPIDDVLKKFITFVKPIYNKKSKILQENQQLTSLRDFLLPMLMNGQVKIK